MRCNACGNENADDMKFCTNCGAPMEAPAPAAQQPDAPRSMPIPQQAPAKQRNRFAIPIAIAAIVIVAAIVVLAVVLLMPAKDEPSPAPDATVATQPAAAVPTFENDVFRITLPADVASQVRFSEEDGLVTMTYLPSNGTLLRIYPLNRAPEYEMEDKAETYALGEASINGQMQQVIMRVDYFGDANTPVHWSAQDATQLGIAKVLGMTPEGLASHIELDTGSGFVTAHASKYDGSASSSTAQGASSSVPSGAFWGIWAQASKDRSEAEGAAQRIRSDHGLDAFVVLTTDWSNLNSEPWYCVSIGSYATEDAAKAALSQARAVYPDAYVKYSGSKK